MLLCDGHGSHFTPEAIARAAEKGVVVFCIPPNTTHVAQPLDVSFFAPLKRYWSSICHTYLAENPGCVVTKLNFSLLFSRAWVKAINPETIINGFRKTGICPFNRSAIIIPESDTSSSSLEDDSNVQGDDNSSSLQVQGDDSSSSLEDDSTVKRDDNHILHGDNLRSSPELFSSFSDDKLALFQRRFESGYDLFIDQDYVAWLQENHPDNLPDELRVPGSGLGGGADLCDAGGGVRNGGWCDMSCTENPLDTSEDMVSVHDCNTSASDLSTLDEGPLTTSKNLPSEMVSESLAETRQVLSAVSAFLTLPSITSKKGKKPPGGARVLTSEQSLALLVDKEKKKREEEEAKEQRKREREEKKQQREEEKKRKSEERERKKAEREQKTKELEERRQQRQEELKQKREQREQAKERKKFESGVTKGKKVFVTRSVSRRQENEGYAPQNCESTSNECTICFGNYSDDLDLDGSPTRGWVECTDPDCNKWMHEDCATRDDGLHVCPCGFAFV